MFVFAAIILLFSGTIFISSFTFIMYCRNLGLDPNLISPFSDDVDIVWSCKLAGIVAMVSFFILYEMTRANPLIHLSLN